MKFQPTTGIVRIGEFFVCNCGVPLLKCVALGVYEQIHRNRGQVVHATYRVKDGMMEVKCQNCNRGMAYINIQEHLTMTDEVKIVTPNPSVDNI